MGKHLELEGEFVRRSQKFSLARLDQLTRFVKDRSTAVDPWTKAKVLDEALCDFFEKHGWTEESNGTAAHKKKTLRANS